MGWRNSDVVRADWLLLVLLFGWGCLSIPEGELVPSGDDDGADETPTVDPASPAGEVTATAAPAVTSWLASGLDDGMVLVACLPSRLAASRPASVPEALYVLGEEPCR